MVASASMAGVPLLNGFLSKEMFFAETVFINSTAWVEIALPVIATIAGTFSVAYALRFTVDVFFGPPPTDLPLTPHEPPRWMRAPVELLERRAGWWLAAAGFAGAVMMLGLVFEPRYRSFPSAALLLPALVYLLRRLRQHQWLNR